MERESFLLCVFTFTLPTLVIPEVDISYCERHHLLFRFNWERNIAGGSIFNILYSGNEPGHPCIRTWRKLG